MPPENAEAGKRKRTGHNVDAAASSEKDRERTEPVAKRPWTREAEEWAWNNNPRDPDVDVEFARYGKTIERVAFGDPKDEIARKEEIATVLVGLRDVIEAPTVTQWSGSVRDNYPETPLPKVAYTKKLERDRAKRRAAARYEFIGEAVKRLMELVNAPQVMIEDFDREWGMPRVNRSDPRAEAQNAYNQNPDLSFGQVEAASKYDRSNVHQAVARRTIRKR